MKLKKFVVVIVCVLFISSTPVVFAEYSDTYDDNKTFFNQVRWSNIDSMDTSIAQSGSKFDVTGNVVASETDGSIKGKLYLQKKSDGRWATVKSWTFKDVGAAFVSKKYNASSGKYRTKFYVNVEGEYMTIYSNVYEVD